jgi:hypothetical protein
MRAEYAVRDMPSFNKVANRLGGISDGEDPILTTD